MSDVCASCGREIAKKHFRCRPCAIGKTTGRHAYIEPCEHYVAEPVAHLQHFTCRNCGFDSAAHPGGGRVALVPVLP